MNDIEKIVNEAWENKDQVNQNSDKSIKGAINQIINDQPINDIEKYKDVIDYKIDNLALFLKKIRLLKEK